MEPQDCTLDDGTRVHVRDIRPDDAAELKREFERLSPESRHQRFLTAVSSLSDRTLHYLTNVDGRNHVAIVATMRDGDHERGIGVARFVRAAERPDGADVAITVTDDMQGRGLGRTLALLLAAEARRRGVEHFRGEVLVDNTVCRQLLESVGARTAPNDDGTLSFDVPLAGVDDTAARRVLRASASGLLGSSADGDD